MKDKAMPDDIKLGEILSNETMSILDREPGKPPKIQDWLRNDHKRNALKRDVEQLQRDVGRVELFLIIGLLMMVLVLSMQLLLWSTGL